MIWFLLAAVFVVYFVAVAGYTGLESKFHLVWLALAVLATLFGVLADQSAKGMIRIPTFFVTVLILISCIGAVVILLTVFQMIRAGRGKESPDAEYVIVLGAHVNGTTISRALQSRLDAAFLYYRGHPSVKLILSGAKGPGEDITEAEAMEQYLLHRGVPEETMIQEDASFSTEENIRNSRGLVNLDEKKVLVVTSRFHLYRALAVCRKQGMKQTAGLAAEDDPLMIPTYYLREVLAILKYRFQKKI